MSTFLPKDYEAPQKNNSYLKFEEGANKFRIVSDAITGYEYWTNDKKPVRLHEAPKGKPDNVRMNDDGTSYTVKHFWAFTVLDRSDGLVKILEITQKSIMMDMMSLLENADWGDPKGYDITVSRSGKGLETKYTVQPSPHKELSAEEKSLVARTEIDLNALFEGESPFAREDNAEINLADVPF